MNDAFDNINRPKHYCTDSMECIDVMIATQGIEAVKSFCVCNALKYIYRHKNKGGDKDLRKAEWYLKKYFDLVNDDEDCG